MDNNNEKNTTVKTVSVHGSFYFPTLASLLCTGKWQSLSPSFMRVKEVPFNQIFFQVLIFFLSYLKVRQNFLSFAF